MRIWYLVFVLFIDVVQGLSQNQVLMHSPDRNIEVVFYPEQFSYAIKYHGEPVMGLSRLGIYRSDADFASKIRLVKVTPEYLVTDHYQLVTGKKRDITYQANKTILETKNIAGMRMNVVFQISNDGVAFRYEFPDKSESIYQITKEATDFHFYPQTRGWLQPKADAQTGFEHTNPSYEAHYLMDKDLNAIPPNHNGWVYPALFKYKDTWILITEADLGKSYCGTALEQSTSKYTFNIHFPQKAETIPGKALLPESVLPWKTPWRIIALGDLKSVAESTLGTDLAAPTKLRDTKYIKPGKASWSWILKKDAATVYAVQKSYIDFSAEMNWRYCLIDAGWDKTIGYDSVKILADYAKKKGIGILLWYNSAGDWNTVKFTPRNKLLTHKSRVREFARLREMGVKGIKVDFFGGDGQSMIQYYEAILEDAATYHLLVNFHGATLPRGLQKTYPNLLTAEAVLGYEMITFSQDNADAAPAHMVMCAFVRNAFDPMDFTPMNLYEIPNIKRATTSCFELATSVIFLSGIQHFASSPEGMQKVPDFVRGFLRDLPDAWDDVQFLGGYPGKSYLVARKSGSKWYVAGINGEDKDKTFNLNLSFLHRKEGQLYYCPSKQAPNTIGKKSIVIADDRNMLVKLHGNDGFIAVFKE